MSDHHKVFFFVQQTKAAKQINGFDDHKIFLAFCSEYNKVNDGISVHHKCITNFTICFENSKVKLYYVCFSSKSGFERD